MWHFICDVFELYDCILTKNLLIPRCTLGQLGSFLMVGILCLTCHDCYLRCILHLLPQCIDVLWKQEFENGELIDEYCNHFICLAMWISKDFSKWIAPLSHTVSMYLLIMVKELGKEGTTLKGLPLDSTILKTVKYDVANFFYC
jgi:hypothetical protein